jgi:hypothetical protein
VLAGWAHLCKADDIRERGDANQGASAAGCLTSASTSCDLHRPNESLGATANPAPHSTLGSKRSRSPKTFGTRCCPPRPHFFPRRAQIVAPIEDDKKAGGVKQFLMLGGVAFWPGELGDDDLDWVGATRRPSRKPLQKVAGAVRRADSSCARSCQSFARVVDP